MRKDLFTELVKLIRHKWNKDTGLLLEFSGKSPDTVVCVCIGAHSNPYFLPQRCKAWLGDSLIYEGDLDDNLRELLSIYGACRCSFTTAAASGNGVQGMLVCTGIRGKDCVGCAARKTLKPKLQERSAYAQQSCVCRADKALPQRGDHKRG